MVMYFTVIFSYCSINKFPQLSNSNRCVYLPFTMFFRIKEAEAFYEGNPEAEMKRLGWCLDCHSKNSTSLHLLLWNLIAGIETDEQFDSYWSAKAPTVESINS